MNITIPCYGRKEIEPRIFEGKGASVSLVHKEGDPAHVYRLHIYRGESMVEICPSKGLSIWNAVLGRRKIFWDSPMDHLADPVDVDLNAPMLINGSVTPGAGWIANFGGGIEMLGLLNWGMAKVKEDVLYCLHGNASSIPVENVHISINDGSVCIQGEFGIHDSYSTVPDSSQNPIMKVTKKIELLKGRDSLFLTDTVTNVSENKIHPDWGYHIQFRPEDGCRYLIPSDSIEPRFGGDLPKDWNQWHKAPVLTRREERGYIHSGFVEQSEFPDGHPAIESRLTYPDGFEIKCLLPLSPFMMTWLSCGGKGGGEFKWLDGSAAVERSWDGIGPEIGAGPLEYIKGKENPPEARGLKPGESMDLRICIEPIC